MARYARFKNGEDRWVWDREKDILYAEIALGSDEYERAKINVQQLSKFMPETKDDGDFDQFPGERFVDLDQDPMTEISPEADLRQRIDTAKRVIRDNDMPESDARRFYAIPDDVEL